MHFMVYFSPRHFTRVKLGLWDIFAIVLFYQCNISYKVLLLFFTHWRICVILSLTTCLFITTTEKASDIPWIAIMQRGLKSLCGVYIRKARQVLWWKIHISNRVIQTEKPRERKSKKRIEKQTENRNTQRCRHILQSRKNNEVRLRACCIFLFADSDN